MVGNLIQLIPKSSPQEYYEANKDQLSLVQDGTGLQILFNIAGEFYLLAGPRQNKVLSVNGGKIEKQHLPFANQHKQSKNRSMSWIT